MPKPVRDPVAVREGRNGGKLNSGGVFPNTGRPPDEFKRLLRQLASRDETLAALRQILDDPSHPSYVKALAFAAERGYGKETQPIDAAVRLTLTRASE